MKADSFLDKRALSHEDKKNMNILDLVKRTKDDDLKKKPVEEP